MNLLQFVRQLQFLLRTAVWPDSPSGPVFAAVHVSQGPTDTAIEQFRYPLALIAVRDGTSDEQEPGIKVERVEVTLAVANAGDQVGEFAMIGGQRASQGTSKGRGLLEVEEQFRSLVNALNATRQVRVIETAASAADATLAEGAGYVAMRTYVLEATLTTVRLYPSPAGGNRLGASKQSSTSIKVTWGTIVDRFDAHASSTVPLWTARGGISLVRKAGSAPTNISDGTVVYTDTTQAASSFTDTGISPGTYYYGLFYKFDENGDGTTSVRYSTTPSVSSGITLP